MPVLRILAVFASLVASHAAFAADYTYEVGTGKADITGPAVGIQMFGFVREGQITEGIHIRLWSRAFVIADPDSGERIAFVCADLGSVPHEMQRAVVRKLSEAHGDTYNLANTIVSATHTHAGPGGYWHAVKGGPLAGNFYKAHFDAIVNGIAASIEEAHNSLAPGNIFVSTGNVEGAGANRSAVAYENNPAEERAKYDNNTDKEMTLLKFVTDEGVVGVLNWFAVHPTSMTYNNRLISGDHKGHAEQRFEALAQGSDVYAPGFVAAFANSNCGDVTPNLNLDNTGPGEDDFESTRIIAERQFERAVGLIMAADNALSGPVKSVQAYVDFSKLEVRDEFTGAGTQQTCASAYGYAFAAGSTEDGGGHPLFKEGMTERVEMIDNTVKQQFDLPEPSDAIRACQLPKAILFAPGEMDPPAQSQILPLSIARIGGLVLVNVPGEITTMAGRRLRETVRETVGDAEQVVIAAYSNHYCGYVTTYEEYQTQQYEGGHTLFGPWMLAGMQQEFARIANGLDGEVEGGPAPRDLTEETVDSGLGTAFDATPDGTAFGDVVRAVSGSYAPGETVEATFRSAHPQNDFKTGNSYLRVERRNGDSWETVAGDDDWETRIVWEADSDTEGAWLATGSWAIPADTPAGTYRMVHSAAAKGKDGGVTAFEGVTEPFSVE